MGGGGGVGGGGEEEVVEVGGGHGCGRGGLRIWGRDGKECEFGFMGEGLTL